MKRKLLEQKTTLVAQFEKEKKQILKDSAKNAQKAALKSVLEKTQKLLQEEINVSDDEDTPPPVAPSSPEPEKIEKRSTRRSNVNIISVEAPKSLNIQPVLLSDPEEVEKEVYTIVDTRFKSENPESDNEDMEPEEMIYYDEVDEENEANGTEYKEQEHLLILNYSNEQQDESKEPTPEDENVNDKGELKIFKCQICSQGFTRFVHLINIVLTKFL